jgi:hypothetical protein
MQFSGLFHRFRRYNVAGDFGSPDWHGRYRAMSADVRHRNQRRGELLHTSLEGAILSASSLFFTLLALLVIYIGVLVFRAD